MENQVIHSISKPNISKDYVYILRSSQLNELLLSNNFSIHTDLIYRLPSGTGSILEVFYLLPNNNVPYERLYVRAGALLKNEVQVARALMVDKVLPEFRRWLDDILQLPENSPILSQEIYFDAVYKSGEVRISR